MIMILIIVVFWCIVVDSLWYILVMLLGSYRQAKRPSSKIYCKLDCIVSQFVPTFWESAQEHTKEFGRLVTGQCGLCRFGRKRNWWDMIQYVYGILNGTWHNPDNPEYLVCDSRICLTVTYTYCKNTKQLVFTGVKDFKHISMMGPELKNDKPKTRIFAALSTKYGNWMKLVPRERQQYHRI